MIPTIFGGAKVPSNRRKASGAALTIVCGGLATAHADVRTITFENPPYVLGSIDTQDGWSGGGAASTDPIDPSVHQAVTNAMAYGGSQAWFVSNDTSLGNHNGAFGGWPFGPPLASAAGQPSSGASSHEFFATFWFKAGSSVADGSNMEVDLGTTGGDDRNSFLAITNKADANGGLQLRIDEPVENGLGGCDNFYDYVYVTNLDRTVWHRMDFKAEFIDGDYNDTIEYFLDGAPVVNTRTGGTTFFTFESYRNQCGYPYAQTNRIYFRSGAAPSGYGSFADGSAAGIFFDNLTYETLSCGPRYVATTGTDIGDNQCDVALNPCLTIQHAIEVACAGDTINVAAGTYKENIVVDKGVTLAGAGQGSTIVQPALSNPNPCTGSSLCGGAASNIILVQADGVTIHDFTLDGDNPNLTSDIVRDGADLDARNGIITNYYVANFHDLEVYNTTIQNIYLRGVYSSSASSGNTFNFHDNIIHNVQGDYYSIGMFAFAASGSMARNTVSDANDAISANWSGGIQFLNNTITNSGSGVHTDNAGGFGTIPADLIQGNIVSDCAPYGFGVWVFAPYVAPTVQGNTITNCAVGLAAAGSGAPVTTVFQDNVVDGAHSAGSTGVYVTTSEFGYGAVNVNATFTGNQVINNTDGFFLQDKTCSVSSTQGCNGDGDCPAGETCLVGTSVTLNVSCNLISGNGTGILTENLSSPASVAISSSSIVDNGVGADGTAIASGNINATGNWWGCAAGPGGYGCDTVTAGVDASSPAPVPPTCVNCISDADCDDSLVCNGAETCNGSHMCQTGTVVSCPTDSCHVGTCTEPSGCASTAQPDGTSCNSGDTCQLGVCTGYNTLSLATVRLVRNYARSATRPNGAARVYAIVNDADTGGGLVSDLTMPGGPGVTLDVQDGAGFSVTITLRNCTVNGRTGKVTCKKDASNAAATFTKLRRYPGTHGSDYGVLYRMKVRRTKLGTSETGSAQPSGPVQVILHQTLVDRPEVMSASTCAPSGKNALVCRG
jgi:hypothetical protein